jgi:hypothetical protein
LKKKRKKSKIIVLSFNVRAKSAVVAPPLSSVLGNLGLNTSKFCVEFNDLTKDLMPYYIIKVYLKLDLIAKSWIMKFAQLKSSLMFKLSRYLKQFSKKGSGGLVYFNKYVLSVKNFFLIVILFTGNLSDVDLKKYYAILKSMKITLVDDSR